MPSSPDEIAHLLRRSGFVAAPGRVDQLSALDWPAAVEAVLDVSANPAENLPPSMLAWDQNQGYYRWVDLVHWWLNRCATTPTPIVEKMTLFWHGHFTTSFDKVYNIPAILSQHRLYRSLATGDFSTLAQRMAVEPAMLWYLDNSDNVAASPNQNFARELMELFLLGVGNYTEADVVSAARAWTGHTTPAWNVPVYLFRPELHDGGDKTLFGVTRNFDGPDVISEILTNPAKRPVVAGFIARKLWEFFAYPDPAPAVVDAVASAFVASGLNVTGALRALFNHPEFRSETARRGLVRSPIEWVVAILHHSGLPVGEAHPEWYFEAMGQQPFNPPNVSGWRPNGYWVNSSAFAGRAEFAARCGWLLGQRGWWADLDSLSIDAAIDRGAATFALPLSAITRSAIANWLHAQRASRERWDEKPNMTALLLLSPEMSMA